MAADVASWLALANTPGVGPVSFHGLCARFGSPRGVLRASRGQLERVPGLRAETLAALLDRRRLVAAERTATELDRDGLALITCDDAAYPAGLRDLNDAPPLLYTLGPLPQAGDRLFSAAGTTTPSARGAAIARAAGRELASAGWTLISGYALGIDSAAHLGALEAGGRTVMVLPTGIRAFTLRREFEPFRAELGRRITLISECAPDALWSSCAAVLRDRIMAALGSALLVVEARPDSGTMITFRHAVRLARPAYVVKYRRAPAGATGNGLAIRAGGVPVESMRAFRRIVTAAALPRTMPKAKQTELF